MCYMSGSGAFEAGSADDGGALPRGVPLEGLRPLWKASALQSASCGLLGPYGRRCRTVGACRCSLLAWLSGDTGWSRLAG